MDVDEFGGDGPAATWSVGELAAATGLTVRTLDHYDEIALATPSLRNHAGQRRYTLADVRRLHRVAALRGFGFSLTQIAGLLDGPALDGPALDARELVRQQLDQVEDRLARGIRLRDRLAAVVVLLDGAEPPAAPTLIRLMAEMTAAEHVYTPAELEQLADRRRRSAVHVAPERWQRIAEHRQAMRAQMTPEQVEAMHGHLPDRPEM